MLALLLGPAAAFAQLTTSNAMTPQQLVQNVLLGPGVTASNITYSGDPQAIGTFGGFTNIGISNGIIMTTGTISTTSPDGPAGPNNSSSSGLDNNFPGDSYLDGIAGVPTFNAAVLEFDFIPNSDTIKFRYVFGSEEYMEYVNAGYNDAFAFVLSGVSTPLAPVNIARLPNSTVPVTIDNVNLFANQSYYYDNGDGTGTGTAPDGPFIQYDGFTVALMAKYPVVCGETYHIKLAIADAGDGIYDSGVFLEAGSFSASNNVVNITSDVPNGVNDSTIYEGCSVGYFIFDRGANNTSTADTLYYTISGSATSGTDYSGFGNNVIFPVGTDSALVSVSAFLDQLPEGTETITLTWTYTNPCTGNTTSDSHTMYIVDTPPLTVTASNDTSVTCPGAPVQLVATAGGGGPGGYNYSWSSGGSTPAITVTPLATTTYTVTVTDNCGSAPVTETVTITIANYQPMQITTSPNTSICRYDQAEMAVSVTGGLPAYTYSWSNSGGSSDTVLVSPGSTTNYTVTVTDACGISTTGQVTVTVNSVAANFSFPVPKSFTVPFTNLSSSNAISYWWDFGDGESSTEENPQHTYLDTGLFVVSLIATSPEGCTDTAWQVIDMQPEMFFYFPNSFTPNGDGLNDVFTGVGIGIRDYNMKIFNRWGELIFESNNIRQGWDGRTSSGEAQQDVYVVLFDVKAKNNVDKKRLIGHVTLIR